MVLFWDPKKENYSVLILRVLFFNFFHTILNPLPLPVFFIPLQQPNMIPWSLAATIKLLYLNFINFLQCASFQIQTKPSYISISKPVTLFIKTSVTPASFAWCPASGFFVPCPNLTSVSTAIVQNSG
jgi:hypothetical protein